MQNKTMIPAIVFLALVPIICTAQDTPRADAVTFLGTELSAVQLKKAVFAVQIQENNNKWIPIGTGFFVLGSNSVVLGVTCKHVVAQGSAAKKEIYIGIDTEKGYTRSICKVPYIDPTNDVAILSPQPPQNAQIQFQNLIFPESLFDDDSSLVEGRGVIITGYPLALGVEDDKNHPVVRIGIVAQFTGKEYFLIDGFASHGNSGSPVFTLKANSNKLVGMVIAHMSDKIILFDESGQVVQLPYNSGLARAITMKAIRQALNNAVGKY